MVFARREDDILHDVLQDLTNGRDLTPRRADTVRWGREGRGCHLGCLHATRGSRRAVFMTFLAIGLTSYEGRF